MQTTVLKDLRQTCDQHNFKMWRAEIGNGPHEIEVSLLLGTDGTRTTDGLIVEYYDDGEFMSSRKANKTEIRGAFLAIARAGISPLIHL